MAKWNWGDWGIRAGALVLACFLWLHAVTERLYERAFTIRLQVEDPPDREVVVANPVPERVRILVSGQGKKLLQVDDDSFILRLKPKGAAGSAHSYRLTPAMVENRTADLKVKIEEIVEPKEIEIVLDRRVEKEVPVVPAVTLEVAEGYVQAGEMRVEPGKVRLVGPERQISRVDWIATDSLRLSNLQKKVDLQVALRRPAGTRIEVSPDHVRLQVDIQELAEDTFERVPVQVRHTAGRKVRPEPAWVRVKVWGQFKAVAGLDPRRDLRIFVDYREFDGETAPVRSEKSDLFEVVEIVPSRVHLVEH